MKNIVCSCVLTSQENGNLPSMHPVSSACVCWKKKLQKTHTNPAQVKQVENCRCESFLLDLSSYFSANHTWTLRNIDSIPSSRTLLLHSCIYTRISHPAMTV